MYKAFNVHDNTEVVILDQKWRENINQLRQLSRQNILKCQGCKQPVRVRAGNQRREHFSHKHLQNCNYADESAVLRNTRAVLYEWLVKKFVSKVTIEKKIDGIDMFRPIDCWVTHDSKDFAYWIFDSVIKPEKRAILQHYAEKLGVQINWVFSHNMLRIKEDIPDELILSTTEREFIQESEYNLIYSDSFFAKYGTLHYLDFENQKLKTFRSLSLIHAPQIYKGHSLTGELGKILVSPKNGEFVHNGEHEKLKKHLQKKRSFDAPRLKGNPNGEVSRDFVRDSFSQNSDNNFDSNSLLYKEAKCMICGKITKDWWSYNGKTGLCKCRPCQKQGKV